MEYYPKHLELLLANHQYFLVLFFPHMLLIKFMLSELAGHGTILGTILLKYEILWVKFFDIWLSFL